MKEKSTSSEKPLYVNVKPLEGVPEDQGGISSKYGSLESLQDISTWETKLFDYINSYWYMESDANYLNITSATLEYEDDSTKVWQVVFTISWGRYYEDDVRGLNEKYTTEVAVEYEFLTNYDYILGLFSAELKKI